MFFKLRNTDYGNIHAVKEETDLVNERSAKALTTRVAIKDEDMHAHLLSARENDRCKNDVGYLVPIGTKHGKSLMSAIGGYVVPISTFQRKTDSYKDKQWVHVPNSPGCF